MFFTWGTAKNAAKFEDTVSSLATHVGTCSWKLYSIASRAMSAVTAPTIMKPGCLVRSYYTHGLC